MVSGSFRGISDDYAAFRFVVPLSSEGVDIDVYADFAFVRKGRVTVQASFQTYIDAFGGGGTKYAASEDGSSVVQVPSYRASGRAVALMWTVLERIPDSVVDQPVEPVEPVRPVEQPAALPEPGEQPADPTAAEEQVRAAYTGIFDSSQPREGRAQLSERPAVWSAANQALVEGEYGSVVQDLHAVVDEVVFTSPTRAAVRFDLVASAGVVSGNQVGQPCSWTEAGSWP